LQLLSVTSVPEDCPSLDVDPYAPEVLRDPYPLHERLREAGPVVHLARYGVWAVARYEQVRATLNRWEEFCSSAGAGLANFRKERPWRTPSLLLENDPPPHAHYRGVVTAALSRQALKELRPNFEAVPERLVDELVARRTFDAATDLAREFPLRVFPDAVGIDDAGRELALQWDVCIEMIQWDGRAPHIPAPQAMEQIFRGAFARLTAVVPAEVELGFHLCYGDMDAKHFIEPVDLGKAVELANLIVESSSHAVKWLHMPVPADRDDAAYFAPLAKLRRGTDTELYLGLVHASDGVDGTVRRMHTVSRFVSDFGIATECGIGRARTLKQVREIMQVHAEAAHAFAC
jgi:hypothetical protein